jgi:hypothetical protein
MSYSAYYCWIINLNYLNITLKHKICRTASLYSRKAFMSYGRIHLFASKPLKPMDLHATCPTMLSVILQTHQARYNNGLHISLNMAEYRWGFATRRIKFIYHIKRHNTLWSNEQANPLLVSVYKCIEPELHQIQMWHDITLFCHSGKSKQPHLQQIKLRIASIFLHTPLSSITKRNVDQSILKKNTCHNFETKLSLTETR